LQRLNILDVHAELFLQHDDIPEIQFLLAYYYYVKKENNKSLEYINKSYQNNCKYA
jgi:hypothetical protein